MNTEHIIKLLKATGIFHDVSEKVLADNISHLKVQHFHAAELIIRKDEIGDSLYIIITGKVKVHDEDYEVAHMGPGDFFGEMSLLSSGPRSMSVSAIEPVEAICIDQASFYTILNHQPAITRNIVTGLVQRLRTQNNMLIEELKSREQELRREVEEQTQLYKEQKERAEQSEKFKEQFLANMSHEIRTPMNAVMGMTNILLEKNPRDDQLSYLDSIRKSSETLLVIINDILDLSKIEAGKMELEHIEFSSREVVDLVQKTLQHKAEEKGLLLNVVYDERIPKVLIGDPTRLNQILVNLVGNAIKFTEKGSINLSVIAGNEEQGLTAQSSAPLITISFAITDTGIGMTQDQLGKIFESFTQASGETTRRFGGTGLGLSISKQLIELQGGKISVKSDWGKGSTFSFTTEYPVSSSQSLSKKVDTVSHDMIAALKGIKILLAEDNEYNRIVAIETLQLKIPGIKIDTTMNGLETLELLKAGEYDVILMDVQMPLMDGYETTRKIRTEFPSSKNQIPIVALTASVLRSDIDRCLQAGMSSYVAKPFKSSDLLVALYKTVIKKSSEINAPLEEAEDKTQNSLPGVKEVSDLTFLKNFCEGDETRMKKYIGMYLESIPKNLEKINLALNEKDYGAVQRTVHALKPHLTYMGMREVRSLADKIESDCKEKKNLSALPELITQLTLLCKKSVEELKGTK